MSKINELSQLAEKNPELKRRLVKLAEKNMGNNEDGMANIIDCYLGIARENNIEMTRDDLPATVSLPDVTRAGGCFITNCGCTLFGEFDDDAGCFIIGVYT